MRFDTKIAIAVRADLAAWQQLNMTAFLASGAAAGLDGLAGKPYEDGSGNRYLPIPSACARVRGRRPRACRGP